MFLNYKRNLLAFSLALSAGLLVACNGSEDFSDASLTSPVLGGDGDPADPDAEAVEIELVAGREGDMGAKAAVVSNLGYSCGGTSGYIPGAADPEGFLAYRARCPFSAESITYYLGDPADGLSRIEIGTVLIPRVSGRQTVGGAGRFQFSVADLINSPERELSTVDDVAFRVALLAALDSDPSDSTDHVIEVPDGAHTVVIEQPGLAPVDLFDQPDYATLVSEWDAWLEAVEIEMSMTLSFPGAEADAQAYAAAGSNRIRSGTWTLDHNATVPYFTRIDDPGSDYDNMYLQMDLLVMPDGTVRGIGQLLEINPSGNDLNTGEFDVVTVANLDESISEGLFLGGGPGADLEIEGVIETGTPSELDVSGRLFSNLGYDAIEIESSGETTADYEEDFPSRDISDLDATEVMRIGGTLFGSLQNEVAMKAGRDGIVSASLEQAILDDLPDFYQITFKVACWEDEGSQPPACETIPEAEQGVNFPSSLGTLTVTTEKPRGDNNGEVRLQILDDGSVITDLDADCADVDGSLLDDNGGDQEYLVGFISATDSERNSANMAMMFSAPEALEESGTMPQFGAIISGRVDLDDLEMPFYLPSDDDFDAGLRGRWLDRYYRSTVLSKTPEEATDELNGRRILAETIGAVEGIAIDYVIGSGGTCAPVALP